jgi:signal transduction histidine kinase/ActR/RegA family two-component response regulator
MKKCFVISPIGATGSETRIRSDEILNHIIRPVLQEFSYEAIRADEISEFGLVTNQIIEHIVYDDLVICDMTSRNPNVYYELAIRHVVMKPIIQIIDEKEDLPFDVINTRTIKINHRSLSGADIAKKNIREYLNRLKKGITKIETPTSSVMDFDITLFNKSSEGIINHTLAKVYEILKGAEEYIKNPSTQLTQADINKMKEVNDMQSIFLAKLTSGLRTPMNAILGFSTLIRNRLLSEKKRRDYIDLIDSNCRHLLHIMTDIIDILKIEAGQISVFNKNFLLNKALSDLYFSYKNQIDVLRKPIKLLLKPGLRDENSAVFTDKVRLEQILSNLLANAIKFTAKGKIEFGYSIDKRQVIVFYVKDTGIGIGLEEQKEIFDRFSNVSNSYNRLHGGTGLGLPISKGLSEKLGGKIWVESEVKKGSTFYFSVPYKPGINFNWHPKIDYINEYNWQSKHILIAEDEDAYYDLFEVILSPTKAIIHRAETGERAIEVCKTNLKINVVLMKIKLPGLDGFEATKQIKEIRKNLPIIAHAEYAMTTDEANYQHACCDDYISKPIQIEDLLNKIDKYLKFPTTSSVRADL